MLNARNGGIIHTFYFASLFPKDRYIGDDLTVLPEQIRVSQLRCRAVKTAADDGLPKEVFVQFSEEARGGGALQAGPAPWIAVRALGR